MAKNKNMSRSTCTKQRSFTTLVIDKDLNAWNLRSATPEAPFYLLLGPSLRTHKNNVDVGTTWSLSKQNIEFFNSRLTARALRMSKQHQSRSPLNARRKLRAYWPLVDQGSCFT